MTDTAETQAGGDDKVVRLAGMRGMIAGKMLESLTTTAQLTHHAECDATGILALKDRLKAQGLKASVEDIILDAVVRTLAKHPHMNGTLKDKEITVSSKIHLGVAIALPGDLLVAPAILDAGAMTLENRVAARRDVVARARTNKLSVTEMTGGTFTVTNLGLSKVHFFTPILAAPQIAILGVGEMGLRPWVHEGEVKPRNVMGLSLTFDHRAVNGAPAADFLTELCANIELIN